MDAQYTIADSSSIFSPALIIFEELLVKNLQTMIRIAGNAQRLRPHCKTHKMREVIELELQQGILKHKCATLAEAEMLAMAGVQDIFLAYNLVGPNIARAVRFVEKYPDVTFSATVDNEHALSQLSDAMQLAGKRMDVLLDIDPGLHRTGVPVGDRAIELYRRMSISSGLRAAGIHLYDGHNHQRDFEERRQAVLAGWEPVATLKQQLQDLGMNVPKIVCGGTGSFPVFAGIDDPSIELSPGTCVFHDAGYGENFPDLDFVPAQLILTRVISRPAENLMTLDLGYKACAADRPSGRRLVFYDLPESEEVLQNEEHLVLRTPRAKEFQPGDELLAVARHACPTSAMYQSAYVVKNGNVIGKWNVIARDRQLTI